MHEIFTFGILSNTSFDKSDLIFVFDRLKPVELRKRDISKDTKIKSDLSNDVLDSIPNVKISCIK
jgi:hypothetical protein